MWRADKASLQHGSCAVLLRLGKQPFSGIVTCMALVRPGPSQNKLEKEMSLQCTERRQFVDPSPSSTAGISQRPRSRTLSRCSGRHYRTTSKLQVANPLPTFAP